MRRARSRPIRPGRAGVQHRGNGSRLVDGRGALGLGLPSLLERVRCLGVGGLVLQRKLIQVWSAPFRVGSLRHAN